MRQTTLLIFGFILILSSALAIAGGNHSHGYSSTPVSQEIAKSKANKILATLVARNKIDKSWATIKASSIEKKTVKGNSKWVSIFFNDKISDVKKQKFFIYLTLGGDYIGATYTGE